MKCVQWNPRISQCKQKQKLKYFSWSWCWVSVCAFLFSMSVANGNWYSFSKQPKDSNKRKKKQKKNCNKNRQRNKILRRVLKITYHYSFIKFICLHFFSVVVHIFFEWNSFLKWLYLEDLAFAIINYCDPFLWFYSILIWMKLSFW